MVLFFFLNFELFFLYYSKQKLFSWLTRMYCIRMCTARMLTVSQHALLGGVPAQWGCTCQGSVPAQGGVPTQGIPTQVLPPLNGMTDRCKDITLPQTSFAGGKNPNPPGPLSKPQTLNETGSRAMISVVSTLSLIIISSLTSPVGAGCPCDWFGGDPQSDYNIISHFTRRCRMPLRSVWWEPSVWL